ncbi:MAG: phage shock protein E [Nitriliruptoraceae bacterium]|jgi:phage shock protein E
MTRIIAMLAVLLLALSGCSRLPTVQEAGGTGVYTVTLEQANERLATVDGLVVLDVRTGDEFAAGHLPGAMQIDFYADDFEAQIAELDRGTSYLIYCAQGGRSGSAGGIMTELGFTDVADMVAGFPSWADAGLPVEG